MFAHEQSRNGTLGRTKTNLHVRSIIDKYQPMHVFTFNTVLV